MPRPSATGTLGATPLLSLLVSGVDHKLSGTLILEDPSVGKTAISWRDGVVEKLSPAQAVFRLGELVVELGLADKEGVDRVIAANQPGLLGQRLVTAQALGTATLTEALREQLVRRLVWVGRLAPTTVYGFYNGIDFLAGFAGDPLEIDPLSLIWRYIERHISEQELDTFSSQLGARELRLHPSAQIQRFDLPLNARAALDVLRAKPQPLAALLGSGQFDRVTLRCVLYALAVTRHLDLGKEGVLPVGVDRVRSERPAPSTEAPGSRPSQRPLATSPPASPRSPAAAALRQELSDLAKRSETQKHHELLGVTEDAPVEAVQAAFIQLARKWHPDRLPATLADLRVEATRVFAKINEAHQVLSNETLRREYYRPRQSTMKSGEHQQVRVVLNAATEFQKAEILAKKHDYAGAEELAERAYKNDPDQAEYGALYAWIVAQNPAHKQKDYGALLKILDQAVKSEPENVKVHFYRANVLKRAGKQEEAIKEFRFVVSREPNNLEASRELRLHKMRSPEEPKGAFGKLFKQKPSQK